VSTPPVGHQGAMLHLADSRWKLPGFTLSVTSITSSAERDRRTNYTHPSTPGYAGAADNSGAGCPIGQRLGDKLHVHRNPDGSTTGGPKQQLPGSLKVTKTFPPITYRERLNY